MRSGAVILGIVVSTILLAAAGALYVLASNNSGQHYRQTIDLVRQIQLVSSEWSMEITRVRSNPFADFDSLAAFIPRIARLKDDLSDTAQRIPGLPDRLASDIQAYVNAVEAQEERVERFKTGYAVVRNSKRYLPLAATNVLRQAQDTKEDALVRNVSSLIRDVNLYVARPTDTSQSRLIGEMKNLREASVGYPPSLANPLANLLSHAEVLVDKQGPTEDLFSKATSNRISDLTSQLTGNLEFELGRKMVLAGYYERGSMAAVVVLILFWILLAIQQRARSGSATVEVVSQPSPPLPDAVPAPMPPEPEPRPVAAAESPPAGPQPVVPAAVPAEAPGIPAIQSSPPAVTDPQAELVHAFLVKCIAGTLAASADEITGRMDYLRRTQQKIREVLHDNDAPAELPEGDDLSEEVEAISAIASSVSQKMNGIADLAKRLDALTNDTGNDLERSMIDINTCVEEILSEGAGRDDTTVVRNLGEIPEIFASKTEFHLLLTEIVDNSLLAISGLEDRTGIVKIDTARKNDEILITVIDNGTGISPERRMNIFKPFYTSRDGAMGIGLTLAGHLVKKYEGVIKINSLPGQGTVARITLPAGISGP